MTPANPAISRRRGQLRQLASCPPSDGAPAPKGEACACARRPRDASSGNVSTCAPWAGAARGLAAFPDRVNAGSPGCVCGGGDEEAGTRRRASGLLMRLAIHKRQPRARAWRPRPTCSTVRGSTAPELGAEAPVRRVTDEFLRARSAAGEV